AHGPCETGAHIVMLALEQLQRALAALRMRIVLLGKREAPREMALRDGLALGGGLGPLTRVLTHGVEQAKALALRDDERLLNQPGEQIDDPPTRDRSARTDLLGSFERKSPGEERETAEEDALLAAEQVVTPVECGPQRLLPGPRRATTGAEHVETV